MDDYLRVQVWSRADEPEAEFKGRLTSLWTNMLRNHESDFEKVYAETTGFEKSGGKLGKQYLFESEVTQLLKDAFASHGIAFEPIDEDDLYSKYEASPPGWFQLEH